jgi:hypothetical protein
MATVVSLYALSSSGGSMMKSRFKGVARRLAALQTYFLAAAAAGSLMTEECSSCVLMRRGLPAPLKV